MVAGHPPTHNHQTRNDDDQRNHYSNDASPPDRQDPT